MLACAFTSSECATQWATKVAILLAFSLPNLLSTRLVGAYLPALAAFVVAPFAVFVAWGAPQVEWRTLVGAGRGLDLCEGAPPWLGART